MNMRTLLFATLCFMVFTAFSTSEIKEKQLTEELSTTSEFDPPSNIWDMKDYTLEGEECTMYVFLYVGENAISEFCEFNYYIVDPDYEFQYWYTFTEIGCQLCEGGTCSPQGCDY